MDCDFRRILKFLRRNCVEYGANGFYRAINCLIAGSSLQHCDYYYNYYDDDYIDDEGPNVRPKFRPSARHRQTHIISSIFTQ